MWPNNAFNNSGQFQQNFNPEDLSAAPSLPSPFAGATGANFFQQPNMMQYEDINVDNSNGFHSELPMINQAAFAQNQFSNPNPPVTSEGKRIRANSPSSPQFSPSQFISTNNSAAPSTPRATQINARAAELREKLMKQKREGRANSATPPVNGPLKSTAPAEPASSMRPSSKTPEVAASDERERREKEINDLISDYSASKPTTETRAKRETNSARPNDSALTKISIPTAHFHDPSSETLSQNVNGSTFVNDILAKRGTRHASNGSMSEGEIFDEPLPKKFPPTEAKGNPVNTKLANTIDKSRKSAEEQAARLPSVRTQDEELPPLTRQPFPPPVPAPAPAQTPNPDPPRHRDDRRDENELRPEKSAQMDHQHDRKPHPEFDKRHYDRKNSRDQNDDHRRNDHHDDQAREDVKTIRESQPPKLSQILPYEPDLRMWLEKTGYHDLTYRSKTLTRWEKLQALEAQKAKLIAELQAEDRGGSLYALRSLTPASLMQPPVMAKVESPTTTSDPLRERITSNKRTYSEVQDTPEEVNYGKTPRIEDRDSRRSKEEESDYRRRQSPSHYELSHHPNGDRESRSHNDEGRHRGRSRSRDREMSPGLRTYESRPSQRDRSFDTGSVEHRPYEVRGGYRGKAFDPNYRGRGRGRGRGDWRGDESRSEAGYGSRATIGKPYKDPRGFDRGGKGDTRYFIVKSFNEENVVKCMQDSVWTTQAQNGPIFKEAFETCKNVILVFSINKSRAFQGYARMESLPGEVEAPSWQKAINWESAGAFRVRWLVICTTRFQRIGHLKNPYNDHQAVLIGKDGQEIEEGCGRALVECIVEEVEQEVQSERFADAGGGYWGS
ncbi:YT521-B-like family protein [Rutstroemia sp. NJR-2017a BVV2]|nr:YT521-B-like family protein [Rutstroemia sp. NJR-2017a BVV2]